MARSFLSRLKNFNPIILAITLLSIAILLQVYRRIILPSTPGIELFFLDNKDQGVKPIAISVDENLTLHLVIRNNENYKLNCILQVYLTNNTHTHTILSREVYLQPGEETKVQLKLKISIVGNVRLVAELFDLQSNRIYSIWLLLKVKA